MLQILRKKFNPGLSPQIFGSDRVHLKRVRDEVEAVNLVEAFLRAKGKTSGTHLSTSLVPVESAYGLVAENVINVYFGDQMQNEKSPKHEEFLQAVEQGMGLKPEVKTSKNPLEDWHSFEIRVADCKEFSNCIKSYLARDMGNEPFIQVLEREI